MATRQEFCDGMEKWLRKEDVLKLIEEHEDLFDGYTDQQKFKDLIDDLPMLDEEESWKFQSSVMPVYGRS